MAGNSQRGFRQPDLERLHRQCRPAYADLYLTASVSLPTGFAVTINRSGAVPKYRSGQQVVRVRVASVVDLSTGARFPTTFRPVTTHVVVLCCVAVVMVSPT